MATQSALRFGAQTDEVTSLLRIVSLVRLGQAITRPELGRATGLGRGVIAQRVDRAVELGYLAEGDLADPQGGRAPRTLRFRSERGLIVGCAMGALHLRVGLSRLTGDVVDDAHRDWDIARGPAETVEVATGMIDELLTRHDATPWGVGVGVPGPVDFASGRAVAPPIMPGWHRFDIRGALADRYGAPVWIDNDVNLLALAERSRRGEERPDLIYCKIGTGIGVGLLSQGRIHRGAQGAAGDIGHEPVLGADAACRCGKTGCLEAVAGGWALVRDLRAAIAAGGDGRLAEQVRGGVTLTPELIAKAAEDGDPLAVGAVLTSARHVGRVLSSLVNLFNPGVIVVGGAVAAGSGEVYLAEVRRQIYEHSLPLATSSLSVLRSVNDPREPVRGAAELVREQLFDVTFPRWFSAGRPTPDVVHPERPAA